MNKKSIKKFLLVWLVACFTVNTTTVAAMMLCHDPAIDQTHALSTEEVPCHNASEVNVQHLMDVKVEIDVQTTISQGHATQDHSAECQSLSCGHCPLLTQAVSHNTLSWSQSNRSNYLPFDDTLLSSFSDGIDYPPKYFS